MGIALATTIPVHTSLQANPLMPAAGFMSSEKLIITLSVDQAELSGVFTWKPDQPVDPGIADKTLAP